MSKVETSSLAAQYLEWLDAQIAAVENYEIVDAAGVSIRNITLSIREVSKDIIISDAEYVANILGLELTTTPMVTGDTKKSFKYRDYEFSSIHKRGSAI